MTARASRLGQIIGPASTGLVDPSLQPGGAITLSFADSVVHVMLDQSGDWTITAGISVFSDRLSKLKEMLEKQGFFQAAEESGVVYHIWTSALVEDSNLYSAVEEKLLRLLEFFQSYSPSNYIS
ncbi:MAG TPA: hypothetical protein VE955_01950 [Candidatus Dormibacteraeota bacterium]|jgi:hypothetical protein|nr:hypothetical protein [Candidatus Dormibacteraeota bacterium]